MDSNYEPYVEFKDLPNTDTPIDADNLNTLQKLMRQDIADNQSVPYGGTTGQVLKKTSDADYDIAWENESTQVVDNLDGNSTTLAPSQNAVKNEINKLSYNLLTGGAPVATGRYIDGNPEYVKRFHFANLNKGAYGKKTRPLGFVLSEVYIINIEAVSFSNTYNWFQLTPGDSSQAFNCMASVTDIGDVLTLTTYNNNLSDVYINLYYVYRN